MSRLTLLMSAIAFSGFVVSAACAQGVNDRATIYKPQPRPPGTLNPQPLPPSMQGRRRTDENQDNIFRAKPRVLPPNPCRGTLCAN